WIDGRLAHTAKIPVPAEAKPGRNAGELNGLWAEFRMPVKAGEHWLSVTILRMYEGLPAAYKGPKPAKAKAKASNNRGVDALFRHVPPRGRAVPAGERPFAGVDQEGIREHPRPGPTGRRGRPEDHGGPRTAGLSAPRNRQGSRRAGQPDREGAEGRRVL